jgi:manganese/iron transport system substrate-binding protein
MLKKIRIKSIFTVSILGIAASLASCNPKTNNNIASAQAKPMVVASHSVICDLIETIAEDTLDLTCLVDGAQDPHTYRPTPTQRKAIEQAQLILYGGYELEPKIIQLVQATKTPAPKIAVYENAVTEPILAEQEHEAEVTSQATPAKAKLEPDSHVWHNVENVVAMVELIQPALIQVNPVNVELYLQNSVALTDQLWQLDAWIDEQIATIPEEKRILVTTHDSLNYYVQAYQLKDYKTLQGLSSESSPTASQLRQLATDIRQTGVPIIFAESTQSDRVISNVAREANVKLATKKLFADGLGEADNYVDMMTSNTCTIVDGLGGKCTPLK